MHYLTLAQILLIHSLLIDETGGMHGVRDRHALSGAIGLPRQKVFGTELYSSIFLKAAVYARNIIMNHSFFDGNKRTGMTAAGIFLMNNGYEIIAERGAIEKTALEIITKRLELKNIAAWFKRNSRPTKKR